MCGSRNIPATSYLVSMDEILDHENENRPVAPPWWPSVLMGGFGGGALLVVFGKIMSQGGPVSIVYLIVTFIVLNSTLTHYRAKLYSNQSYLTAISICFGTYLIMMATNVFSTYALFGFVNYDFPYSRHEPFMAVIVAVVGGFVVSAVAALLSKKYHQ